MRYFIDIDYEEVGGDNYKGVVVRSLRDEIARFNTGDVENDWLSLIDFCVDHPAAYMFSSSVDHFVMDVEGYGWKIDEDGNEVIVKNPIKCACCKLNLMPPAAQNPCRR